LKGAVFAFHVTLSILAYAAFALSFVLSLIFLGEERLLRKHELGNMVWRLPPLELLERMSRSSVLVGLVSIAIGTAMDSSRWTVSWASIGFTIRICCHVVVLLLYVLYSGLRGPRPWRGASFEAVHFQFCCGGAEFTW